MHSPIKTVAALAIPLLAVGVISSAVIQRNLETATIEVVSKERLLNMNTNDEGQVTSSYENFVYSNDEAYVVADSLWNWHFRARSVYAQIQEGAICEVTLSGYRWGFLSMHQNIIAADCS